jgi:EpsI family protein
MHALQAMKISVSHIVLLALMLVSAGMASALRPTISLADERTPISLKTMVPAEFGEWREQQNVSAAIVDPQQRELLDKIYSETLTRTYVNSAGYRIMLSIAYGKNQSDALQLHKPEVCYPAQGFALLAKQASTLDLSGTQIATIRLQTSLGQRFEPITYWTVVGDRITTSGINKKLTEMRYALKGRIPDGMLIRVSSIDTNVEKAYAIQGQFAQQMVQAIGPEVRKRFAGDPAPL